MEWWQLVILALIQGATEWLPISSSAHLILFPQLTGLPDQGPLIDAMAHLGSLGAVLVYFRRDVASLFAGFGDVMRDRAIRTRSARLLLVVLIATIPGVAFGAWLTLTDGLDALRHTQVIAWATIIFALFLWAADRWGRDLRQPEELGAKGAVILGLMQALAFIPGASRSGVAMTAARALGIPREDAARIALVMGIPLIAMVGGYALLQLAMGAPSHAVAADGTPVPVTLMQGLVVGVLSFAAALASITAMMALLKRIDFTPFVIYRLILGAALLFVAG